MLGKHSHQVVINFTANIHCQLPEHKEAHTELQPLYTNKQHNTWAMCSVIQHMLYIELGQLKHFVGR